MAAEPGSPEKSNKGARQSARYASEDDVTLVAACLNGDYDAWNALIVRYQGIIYSVALKRGLSRQDAEDVFQNVCVKLYEHLGDLRDVQRLSGWLASVTTRECAQLFRRDIPKLFSESEMESEESDRRPSVHAAPSVSPEEEVLAMERRHLIAETMDNLSGECRKLLVMLYNIESPKSYNEIADELSIPLGSIGPRRARCLSRLRSLLDRHGY